MVGSSFFLQEGLLTSFSTCKRCLGFEETVHLLTALCAAFIEGSLHPVTLWLERLPVLLLVLFPGQGFCLVLPGISNLLVGLCLKLLKGSLLGPQVVENL